MGYTCTLCFFQCHVTLHPSVPCCTCKSQQHTYGSPSEAQFYCQCLPLKAPRLRLFPPKLPEPQVHLVHVALLPASGVQGVGQICDAMRKFCALVLMVQERDGSCHTAVQK